MSGTSELDAVITNAGVSPPRRGTLWWAAQAAGAAIMLAALAGILGDQRDVPIDGWGVVFLGGALIHDGLVVFVVAGLATLCRRFLPKGWREPVTWFMWVGVIVVFVYWPEIAGFGLKADNPSVLPRDYGRNVWIGLGVVALVAAFRAVWSLTSPLRGYRDRHPRRGRACGGEPRRPVSSHARRSR